jgi:hypothetical protein
MKTLCGWSAFLVMLGLASVSISSAQAQQGSASSARPRSATREFIITPNRAYDGKTIYQLDLKLARYPCARGGYWIPGPTWTTARVNCY